MSPFAAPELATERSVPLLPLLTRLDIACEAKYLLAGASDLNKEERAGIAFTVALARIISLFWNRIANSSMHIQMLLSSSTSNCIYDFGMNVKIIINLFKVNTKTLKYIPGCMAIDVRFFL